MSSKEIIIRFYSKYPHVDIQLDILEMALFNEVDLSEEDRIKILEAAVRTEDRPGLCRKIDSVLVKYNIFFYTGEPSALIYVLFPEVIEISEKYDADFYSAYWWDVTNNDIRVKVLNEAIEVIKAKTIHYANTERD